MYLADVKYKNPNVLSQSFNLTIESLLRKNEEVPVKVEAAIALQMMLSSQGNFKYIIFFSLNQLFVYFSQLYLFTFFSGDSTKAFVEPRITEITMELLEIIRQTENDDLTTVCTLPHSTLKLEKKCNFKSAKKHY